MLQPSGISAALPCHPHKDYSLAEVRSFSALWAHSMQGTGFLIEDHNAEDMENQLAPKENHWIPLIRLLDEAITLFRSLLTLCEWCRRLYLERNSPNYCHKAKEKNIFSVGFIIMPWLAILRWLNHWTNPFSFSHALFVEIISLMWPFHWGPLQKYYSSKNLKPLDRCVQRYHFVVVLLDYAFGATNPNSCNPPSPNPDRGSERPWHHCNVMNTAQSIWIIG